MGIFQHFPYSNFHNLNLDRILERTKEAEEAVQTAEAAAEAAAASIATIANAPADAYKELTLLTGDITADTSNTTIPSGGAKYTGFTLTGSNIIFSLYGLLLKGNKTFASGTYYKILNFSADALQFFPDHMFSAFYSSTDKDHDIVVFVARNQSGFSEGDGVFILPLANFGTDAAGEAIVAAPSVIPFFSDIV